MTPDDMTRLADRLDRIYGKPDEEAEIDAIVAELRTLAQQGNAGDHIEDKLAMVAANSPEAGVTDEMAQRAYRHWNHERARAALGIEGDMDDGLGMMKRAISAAMTAPQPKDAT